MSEDTSNPENGDLENEVESVDDGGSVRVGLVLLFVGLAAGAIVALLLAPKTGKQMRRHLRRKYQDAREVVDDWGEHASDLIERGSDWAEKASDWADQAKAKVKPLRKAFQR